MKKDSESTARRRRNLAIWIEKHCSGLQSEFISITGINQGELSGLLKDKSFGEKKAEKLEEQAGMPKGYLTMILDEDEAHEYSTSFQENETEESYRNKSNIRFLRNPNYKNSDFLGANNNIRINQYVDVGGSMGRGVLLHDQPGQIDSWEVTEEWLNKNIPANTGDRNLCIVTGFGDSMLGEFNPGDPIIVDTGIKDCDHDGIYFFRVGDEGFIKTLQRIPGQGIRVISSNPKYESWTITKDMDFQILGKVLKVWKGTRF